LVNVLQIAAQRTENLVYGGGGEKVKEYRGGEGREYKHIGL